MELYEKKDTARYQRLVKEQCVREDAVRMTVQRSKEPWNRQKTDCLPMQNFYTSSCILSGRGGGLTRVWCLYCSGCCLRMRTESMRSGQWEQGRRYL